MAITIATKKENLRGQLLRSLSLGTKIRSLILLDIADPAIATFLISAGKELDIAFVQATGSLEEKGNYLAYDAVISDMTRDLVDIIALIQSGVIPILPKKNPFVTNFTEFDPMKFTGNSFLFETIESYHIFEKMVRYLENVRYAGDKSTLMKNLGKTF